jgi:hypothetical protein
VEWLSWKWSSVENSSPQKRQFVLGYQVSCHPIVKNIPYHLGMMILIMNN